MSAPILHSGDQVHLVLPMVGHTQREAERHAEEIRAAYAALGVNVAILTHVGLGNGKGDLREVSNVPQVVAVFRENRLVMPEAPRE